MSVSSRQPCKEVNAVPILQMRIMKHRESSMPCLRTPSSIAVGPRHSSEAWASQHWGAMGPDANPLSHPVSSPTIQQHAPVPHWSGPSSLSFSDLVSLNPPLPSHSSQNYPSQTEVFPQLTPLNECKLAHDLARPLHSHPQVSLGALLWPHTSFSLPGTPRSPLRETFPAHSL